MGVLETTPRGVSIQMARATSCGIRAASRKDGTLIDRQAVLASAFPSSSIT